jgi:hypothetical protein
MLYSITLMCNDVFASEKYHFEIYVMIVMARKLGILPAILGRKTIIWFEKC